MLMRRINIWIFSIFVLIVAVYCTRELTDKEKRIQEGIFRKACSKFAVLPQPESRVNTTDRLIRLRKIMNEPTEIQDSQGLQAVIVTSDDDHQTEFVSDYDKRREYISGFSGSGGDAIITMEKAALWTDGRYHLQADDQLDCYWLLMREGIRYVPTQAEWLNLQFPNGARIGADPGLMSADYWNGLEYALALQNKDLKLVKTNINLIDKIWLNHKETDQEKEAFTLNYHYTGKNWTEKVTEVRRELKKLGAEAMVVTALDEISWLLNIRGRDIPYTRFVKSYVLLSEKEIKLFVDKHKTEKNVTAFFNAQYPGVTRSTVTILDYGAFWNQLITYCQAWKSILVPSACVYSAGASKKIYDTVPEDIRISKPSPIIDLKAIKNEVEIEGMKNAHVRDGAAMCKFIEYFESRFKAGDEWDELKVAKAVDRIRMEQDLAVSVSFRTIVGFGAHGAQPHYEPSVTTTQRIFDNSTLIIDSGGHYLDGTTDVTRTLHLGTPTEKEKDMYTRVLMASIQLSTLIFPDNLNTSSIDVMARAPIWEIGQDYPHGTGHGVGAFLGVHESPIYVHYNPGIETGNFKPGHFFSNEPGIYLEDKFGVRLENVLEVVEKPHIKHQYGHSYLGFKDVTLVPYSSKLIHAGLLSFYQRRWLNDYNARIRREVGAELKRQNATEAFYWMMENTKYIPEYGHSNILTSQPLYVLVINVIFVKFSIVVLY